MNGSFTPIPYASNYVDTVLNPSKTYIANTHFETLQTLAAITLDETSPNPLETITKLNLPEVWVEPIVYQGYRLRPLINDISNVTLPSPLLMLLGDYKIIMAFNVQQNVDKKIAAFDTELAGYTVDSDSPHYTLARNCFRYVWGGNNTDPTFLDSIRIIEGGLPILMSNLDTITYHQERIRLDKTVIPDYTIHPFYMNGLIYLVFLPPDEKLFDTVVKCSDQSILKRLLIDEINQRALIAL